MGLYDNHNHSEFSFDGKQTTVEASSFAAEATGLAGICFTDHYDVYTPPMKAAYEDMVPEMFDIRSQQAEIDRVQALVKSSGSSLRLFKGIEVGVQKKCRNEIRKVLLDNQFDEVIASCHYLDDTDPYWGGYYEGKDWREAYGHYLETLYEEIVWLGKDFDIMGHYDYVTRYAPYAKESILYEDFSDVLDEMLKFLADNGKALEINTKTYQTLSGRTPVLDPDILRRYRELGGEALSLGSDSHNASMVGFNFPVISQYLKTLGFKYLAHFERRELKMERI